MRVGTTLKPFPLPPPAHPGILCMGACPPPLPPLIPLPPASRPQLPHPGRAGRGVPGDADCQHGRGGIRAVPRPLGGGAEAEGGRRRQEAVAHPRAAQGLWPVLHAGWVGWCGPGGEWGEAKGGGGGRGCRGWRVVAARRAVQLLGGPVSPASAAPPLSCSCVWEGAGWRMSVARHRGQACLPTNRPHVQVASASCSGQPLSSRAPSTLCAGGHQHAGGGGHARGAGAFRTSGLCISLISMLSSPCALPCRAACSPTSPQTLADCTARHSLAGR